MLAAVPWHACSPCSHVVAANWQGRLPKAPPPPGPSTPSPASPAAKPGAELAGSRQPALAVHLAAQAYVTTYSGDTQRQYCLVLAKETRDRFQEDSLASRMLLRAVAEASGVSSAQLALGQQPGDDLQVRRDWPGGGVG